MKHEAFPAEGGCDCGAIRYRLASAPLIVHACHCRWCQRESGSAFALNAMIEADRVTLLRGTPELIDLPTASGAGQRVARCPHCRLALWSHYAGAGPLVSFVRVGTLDEPDIAPPDIHIFTSTKQPWLPLPADVRAVPEYYDMAQEWPAESLARREALKPALALWRASRVWPTLPDRAPRRSVRLRELAGDYGIARLDPGAAVPDWAGGAGFLSVSRSADELSITCRQEHIPSSCTASRDWACLQLVGPFAFDETGIVLAVIEPLSRAAIGIFIVSTYDGDHLLLPRSELARARALLRQAGHVFVED
ncbi:GFA family protein [Uliginosibacterium paludis]|uniref:GFA family protein n=1 Tax=Uliginosibacterium paludis TaxID=1615952 RepID=A0ABV2CSI7_9RHOO